MRKLFVLAVLASLLLVGYAKSVNAPVWEDLQFPISGVNPAGPAAAPTQSTADGLWDFSGTTDNVAVFWVQMPHGWSQSLKTLDPHIHWLNENTTVATAVFSLQWRYAAPFANFSGTWDGSSTIVLSTTNSTATHQISTFANITIANPKHSGMLQIQLSRLASSDSRDTHNTGAIRLLAYDLHYVRESNGSFAQYGDTQ
jgi:hypothetical protein